MDFKTIFGKMNQGLSIAEALSEGKALTDPRIAVSAFLNRRISTMEEYEDSFASLLYPSRHDYPELQEREVVSFRSGTNELKGYLYRVLAPRGIVLCVHGYHSLSDNANANFQAFFVRQGFDVFAMDLTACGRSDGFSIVGMQQAAFDVVAAETYLSSRPSLALLPLYLFGHSWGAYGVLASLNFNTTPKAVFAFSGFTDPVSLMLGSAESKVGTIPEAQKEGLIEALKERDPNHYRLSAVTGIENAKHTDVYLFHGEEDKAISKDIAAAAQSYSRPVAVRWIPVCGHSDLFYSAASRAYVTDVKALLANTVGKYKKVSQIPAQEKADFQNHFDRRLCAVLEPSIWDEIKAELLKN